MYIDLRCMREKKEMKRESVDVAVNVVGACVSLPLFTHLARALISIIHTH